MEDDGPPTKTAYGEVLADKLESAAELAQELAELVRNTDFMLHERDDFWRKITMIDYDLRGMRRHIGG